MKVSETMIARNSPHPVAHNPDLEATLTHPFPPRERPIRFNRAAADATDLSGGRGANRDICHRQVASHAIMPAPRQRCIQGRRGASPPPNSVPEPFACGIIRSDVPRYAFNLRTGRMATATGNGDYTAASVRTMMNGVCGGRRPQGTCLVAFRNW